MSKLINFLPFLLLVYILAGSCAQIGQPIGGPRDTIPPVLTHSFPANYSTGFNKDRVTLFFNEFVDVKNVNKIFVSPPLKEKPTYIGRGKSVDIEISDTLAPNTTYTINFGNSVQDYTENNPIKDFRFVMSTGDKVDSLELNGKVLDAATLKPLEDAWVMVYENYNDSTPYKTTPNFLGKTNKDGVFKVKNIRKTSYRAFVLKETNNNYKYDALNEDIGFTLNNYSPDAKRVGFKDTLKVKAPRDTVFRDSIIDRQKTVFLPDSILFFAFREDNAKQYCSGKVRNTPDKLSFAFNKAFYDTVTVTPMNFSVKKKWFETEKMPKGDSLHLWIVDKDIASQDSLALILNYTEKELAGAIKTHADTVKIKYVKPIVDEKQTKKKEKEKEKEKPSLRLAFTASSFLPGENPCFSLSRPRVLKDLSKISLVTVENSTEKGKEKDKIETPVSFSIQDSSLARRHIVVAKWEADKQYKMTFLPGAYTDITGLSNDTVISRLSMEKSDMLGSISLSMKNVSAPLIVKLTDESLSPVREIQTGTKSEVLIKYIKPGKYKLVIVMDKNKNGRWDTGKYIGNIQPETILVYSKILVIRPNWEQQVEWELPK
jgi:hypothetical protein